MPTPQLASTTWRRFTGRWATTPKPNRFSAARWRFSKCVRPGASLHRRQPQQPCGALRDDGELRQSRTDPPPRVGDSGGSLGPEHPDPAISLNNLAELLPGMGDYAKAEPLYRAPGDPEKASGPGASRRRRSLNNLAALYQAMGDYAKAEPLVRRALAIREKALGTDHPDTATEPQQPGGAVPSHGRATPRPSRCTGAPWRSGRKHSAGASRHRNSLNNLAVLHEAMGDYAEAEPLYRRALAILEKALGPGAPRHRDQPQQPGGAAHAMGDYARPSRCIRRALAIRRKRSARTSRHRQQPQQPGGAVQGDGGLRQSRAALPARAGDLPRKRSARSIPTPQSASTTWRRFTARWATTPRPSRSTAARWRFRRKRSARSIPTLPSASTTWRGFTGRWATTPEPNRSSPHAGNLRKSARPGPSRDRPQPREPCFLKDRCWESRWRTGIWRARPEGARAQLGNILSFTSEQQRLAFQKTTIPFTLLATLGSAPDLARAFLAIRGRCSIPCWKTGWWPKPARCKQREVIDELRAAKQLYTQLLIEVPKTSRQRPASGGRLNWRSERHKSNELEASAGPQVSGLGRARRALSVTLAQVQGALADQVLVELLATHYIGEIEWKRYGALVIASRGEPSGSRLAAPRRSRRTWSFMGNPLFRFVASQRQTMASGTRRDGRFNAARRPSELAPINFGLPSKRRCPRE